MAEIQNFIKMDKENIEKFKKLYEKNFAYEDDLVLFSFAMIEPNQKEWGTGDAFDDMGETFFCSTRISSSAANGPFVIEVK